MNVDYQNNDYTWLAALFSEKEAFLLLQVALSMELFDAIEQGRPFSEINGMIDPDPLTAEYFLDVLQSAGLIVKENGALFNAPVASAYLVKTSPSFCGDFDGTNEDFLWWRLLPMLGDIKGKSFFAEDFPWQTVPEKCGLMIAHDDCCELVFCGRFKEAALARCAADGILVIVGYFRGNYGLVGATRLYRQRLANKEIPVLDYEALSAYCGEHGFFCTAPQSLTVGFSVVFLTKRQSALKRLTLTAEDRLIATLRQWKFSSIKRIDPSAVVTASWVRDHCRFGCSSYGERHCPPFSPDEEETRTKLSDYRSVLLIEGQPPTRDFQRLMLEAEKEAFKAGFYKAFAYWAGPCSLCTECNKPLPPKKCTATRPSMESAGIDVFVTVRQQSFALRTLTGKEEFVKYFGLLLLE